MPITAPRAAPGRVSRVVDVVLSAALLLLLLPLLLVIGLLVRLTSPGSALFAQERLGKDKRPFTCLKFRTMVDGCSDSPHREYVTVLMKGSAPQRDSATGLFKLADDQRITPLGALLRRTSLDELPQLWNVLRGDMALVGPRPALPYEPELYAPRHHDRFAVRPGITGLWQVSGRSLLTMEQALDLDVDYVHRRTIGMDLRLLLQTLPVLLTRRGAA